MTNGTGSLRVQRISWQRRLINNVVTYAAMGASIVIIVPLVAILGYLLMKGIGAINWDFITQLPKPVGETGGGMGNAIVGSMIILLLASLFGIPLGIGAGIYLAEFGRNKFGNIVRFTSDVLNGVPSIVVGIAVYGLVVVRQKHFSALAGGVALGIMMIPTIARSTEEMLLMVPRTIREAAWGLGVPQWRATLSVTLKTASAGVITGTMLAFARAAGETAPLLFTALGNTYWNLNVNQPTAAVPLQVYVYALSPFDEWHRLAWAGALVLIILILASVTAVRVVTSRGMYKGAS